MIIATRTLSLDSPDGRVDVPIHIHAPEPKDRSWVCRYEIHWPHGALIHEASGLDAVQALLIAHQLIGVTIYTSSYHQSGLLKWTEPGEGYGFPVPTNIHGLLVGQDRKYGL
jgi:hypothetical protein